MWNVILGALWECQRGTLMAHDLYFGLPSFMTKADCVFVDPPYGLSQENSYRTKAGLTVKSQGFDHFLSALFAGVDQINPKKCFVEIGKQNVGRVNGLLARRFPFNSIWKSHYYRNPKNACYILYGGAQPAKYDYTGVDETDIIRLICMREEFDCIADPCIGRGEVAYSAFVKGREFVGTDLNPARLAVGINRIAKAGGVWKSTPRL